MPVAHVYHRDSTFMSRQYLHRRQYLYRLSVQIGGLYVLYCLIVPDCTGLYRIVILCLVVAKLGLLACAKIFSKRFTSQSESYLLPATYYLLPATCYLLPSNMTSMRAASLLAVLVLAITQAAAQNTTEKVMKLTPGTSDIGIARLTATSKLANVYVVRMTMPPCAVRSPSYAAGSNIVIGIGCVYVCLRVFTLDVE